MDFVDMKRRDLQALCKKHNLPASGTNSDLVSRLTDALKEEEVEAKPVTRHGKKRKASDEEETVDLGKGSDVKKSRTTGNEAGKKKAPVKLNVSEKPVVSKDVPVPTRATRSRGAAEVVDIHSFPVENKKKSTRGGGEKDSSDGGVKNMAVRATRSRGVESSRDGLEKESTGGGVEKVGGVKGMAVRATRSRGGVEEASVPPNIEKIRGKKEGNTKNHSQVKDTASVRTTRSRVGGEVTDINHSSSPVKKSAKGKGGSTKNEDGLKKEISVRTTRSRGSGEATEVIHSSPVVKKITRGKGVSTRNEDGMQKAVSVRTTRSKVTAGVVSGHASPPVERKNNKRGRVSTEKVEEVKESSIRTTRSRPGANVAISRLSPPAGKKSTKNGKVSIKNDDEGKTMPVRTTRSRVGAETSVAHFLSSPGKNKRKRGQVNTEDNGVDKEISARTTRSRDAAVTPIKGPSPVVKNKVKGVNTKSDDGVEEVPGRTTRPRLGTETGILSSVAKKRTPKGEKEIKVTKTQKDVQVTRSSRGKEIKGNNVNTEKNTPPTKRRKVIAGEHEEEVKEAVILKKSTKATSQKMGNKKSGKKGKGTLKLKKMVGRGLRKMVGDSRRQRSQKMGNEKIGKKGKGILKLQKVAPKRSKKTVEQPPKKSSRAGGSNSKHKEPTRQKVGSEKNGRQGKGTSKPAKKAPKLAKRLKEQAPKKSTRDGGSNSKHKEPASNIKSVPPRGKSTRDGGSSSKHKEPASNIKPIVPSGMRMQVDENSKKTPVQKQVGTSIKIVRKSYSTRDDTPQRATRSTQRHQFSNDNADSSVHKLQGSLDVPSSVSVIESTRKVDETGGIAEVVAESITLKDDEVPIGVEIVQGGLIDSIDEATQVELEAQNVDNGPSEKVLDNIPVKEISPTLQSVAGINEEVSTSNNDDLDPASQQTINVAEGINTDTVSEDIPVQGATGATLPGIPSGSNNEIESKNDLVEAHDMSLQDEVREELGTVQQTVDIAGADGHTEIGGGTPVDETSTGLHVESSSQDIAVAGEINSPVTELEDQNEEFSPTFKESLAQSNSRTVNVAGEINELDTCPKSIDVLGEHSKMDDNSFVEASTSQQNSESLAQDIDVARETNHPVQESMTVNLEGFPTSEESPILSSGGTIDVAEENDELHLASERTIEVAGAGASGESPIQSSSGTVDVAEENNELDEASKRSIEVAGADDYTKTDGDMLVEENSTGQKITETDATTLENVDAPGEVNPPVLDLETQIDKASPIPEEPPIQSTGETSQVTFSGTMSADESEKDSLKDNESLSDETRHTDHEAQVDGNVDTSRDDHGKFGDLVCGSPAKEISGTHSKTEIGTGTQKSSGMTEDALYCQLEMHKEPLAIPEEVTMSRTVETSTECAVSAEKDVGNNEEVEVGVSHPIEFSETPVATEERSVEDASATEQQNGLVRADPAVDVSHLSNSEPPKSREAVIFDDTSAMKHDRETSSMMLHETPVTLVNITGERSVEDTCDSKQHNELAQAEHIMDVSRLSTADSPKSEDAMNFDDTSPVEHDRETNFTMIQESPESSVDIKGERSAEDTSASEQQIELAQADPAIEDVTMTVLPESSQSKAELGFEDTGRGTSAFQETADASLDQSPDDAELVVEDFGEASVAKNGEVSKENIQPKLIVMQPSDYEAMNHSFKLLIDQFCEEHPGECDTSATKTHDSQLSQGVPELRVEDVGKGSFLTSQEVLEENSELSKEVHCGSESDTPEAKVTWDENNEASVEEFDHIPVNDERGDFHSSKEELITTEVLDSGEMVNRDFDFRFSSDVWDVENAGTPPIPQGDLDIFDVQNENNESGINVADEKPSGGSSEMFVDFNDVSDLHLNPHAASVSPFYTQGNVNEQNFGGVEHYIQRDTWHISEEFVDLKDYAPSESQSHVEFSHVHHELLDPKVPGPNFSQGQETEYLPPGPAGLHAQSSKGSDFDKARESSPGSSRRS